VDPSHAKAAHTMLPAWRLNQLLAPLSARVPELVPCLRGLLADTAPDSDDDFWEHFTQQSLWALRLEPGFGQAVAKGLASLVKEGAAARRSYHEAVQRAVQHGPTLGRIVAATLAPVLRQNTDRLLEDYERALAAMLTKGTHIIEAPLGALGRMADEGDRAGASSLARLAAVLFTGELSYQRCRRLAEDLPACALRLAPERRAWQLDALRRLAHVDHRLTTSAIEGLNRGLETLPRQALEAFITRALAAYRAAPQSADPFFSLESRQARSALRTLHPAVALNHIRPALERYLRARLGRAVAIEPLSASSNGTAAPHAGPLQAQSDGRTLFLPAAIDFGRSHEENRAAYKLLVRLEAGLWEWGTFAFDLRRVGRARHFPECNAPGDGMTEVPEGRDGDGAGDLERFCGGWDDPELALDLFTLVEHARLARCLTRRYPGLAASVAEPMGAEIRRLTAEVTGAAPFLALYAWCWPGLEELAVELRGAAAAMVKSLAQEVCRALATPQPVEACARVVAALFVPVRGLAEVRPLPFGRRLRPDLYHRRSSPLRPLAVRLQRILADAGVDASRGALLAELVLGPIPGSADELQLLWRRVDDTRDLPAEALQRAWQQWCGATRPVADRAAGDGDAATAFHYPEWDEGCGDYLADHVWLRELPVPGEADDAFYRRTLRRHHTLVGRLRQAFERMRPQGLERLRRWPEGDSVDLDAVVEHAVERRVHATAGERLYLKHLQHARDVAVLLLVDLSRSTASPLDGGATVLDIEKAAMVLFCEALAIVGDRFALAGFSGSGQRGVEFYPIKAFDEVLDARVQGRIGALQPCRNTRMGAAVRHAAARLAAEPARARLLLVLSDGYPNDAEYRGARAIEDTARAVSEARSRGIHSHGVSVLSHPDRRLDRLYGPRHHIVIADVRELPDQLTALYRRLTQH
jgi:Mg-chelatase subunit ChlD